MKKQLRHAIEREYKKALKDSASREWHAREVSQAAEIRRKAVEKTLDDGWIAAVLYGRYELLGNFGNAWNQIKRPPTAAQYPAIRNVFSKLLAKVAGGKGVSKTEFDQYKKQLGSLGVPSAVANRFAAACFPSQLAATVTDSKMSKVYRKLSRIGKTAPVLTNWFEQNEQVVDWIRTVLPNTDDAWRAVLVWRLR